MKKLIVYGDIHGCFNEFIELRKMIAPRHGDIEVCVGDVITKGRDSIKVLDYLISYDILSVLGNHEYKLICYLKQQGRKQSKKDKITLNDDEKNIINHFSAKHVDYIKSMPLFLKFRNIVIMHGGLQNSMHLNSLSKSDMHKILCMRYLDRHQEFLERVKRGAESLFWADVYNGHEGFVVYGHTPFDTPRLSRFALGIDTGCVYGNRLSAAVFSDTATPSEYTIYQKNYSAIKEE